MLINTFHSKKNKKYKVSIISPVYNSEKYITTFVNSIQNQMINEIEIIFIDDFSSDKSIETIEKYQKKDNRIKLIKNTKNRGTFVSRNIGVLKSKGDYLMFIDPDDIISENIIRICYNLAIKNKFEIIRFYIYLKNKNIGYITLSEFINELKSIPIYQPELSTYLFYGLGRLRQIDYNISNKFIKRSCLISVFNYLEKYYLDVFMIISEDGLINFMLYRTAKSFYFLKKIGYYYYQNKGSISERYDKLPSNLFFSIKYFYSKIIFDFTKNILYEKNIVNYYLDTFLNMTDINCLINFLKNDFSSSNDKDHSFYNYVINIYLESKLTNISSKEILKKLKDLI
jgi:glycosyltransferase involved in cell wall biosynthesis